jgi:5'-3' exonuclease
MLALIDGDLLVYRIGFTTEDVDEGIVKARLRESINLILEAVEATEFKIYLTAENDPTAFRKRIYPEYKANRVQPKPKHYSFIREHLQGHYDAEVCHEIEADDGLGISQTDDSSVIVSIDKDLKQIPGNHYNFVKLESSFVTPEEGLLHFYTQLLTGDSSDNIKGVWKCGPVKAANILAGTKTELQMFQAVRDTYSNDEEMLMNGRVLWIWKQRHDDWINHYQRLNELSQTSQD